MTQQPFSAAALRGAVDLSALSAARKPAQPGAGAGPDGGAGDLLLHVTDETFTAAVNGTTTVPALLVLWAAQVPESQTYLQTLVDLARETGGRVQVLAVDLGSNPGIAQALGPVLQQAFGQVSGLPVVLGLLQGQPVPFFVGAQPPEQVRPLLDQFLQAAVANGITGRVDTGAPADGDADETPLPPLHQQAYDAIERGDLDAAAQAYRQALADNPGDEDARLGLAQVELLLRTRDLQADQVRQAAAADPADVTAQCRAADLEVVGGHVEDGLARLIDTVRRTAGEDRDRAREHLVGLFDVVGPTDPRVAAARRSLMSALF